MSLIDTIQRTISISHNKLEEIFILCQNWSNKTYTSKMVLQSIIHNQMHQTSHVLGKSNADLAWFNTFLTSYSGITFYYQLFSRIPVHLESCLTGLGGHFDGMIYNLPVLPSYINYDITQLEMINIVVASNIWSSYCSNKKFRFFVKIWPLFRS